MFSFFKTKKPSPSSSPESDAIPSASSNDFVIVDPKQGPNQNPLYPNPYASAYPNFDQHFGNPSAMPAIPNRPPLQHSDSVHHSNYVNDIPFKLSSELSTGNSNEITRIQVDDILSMITSKMGIAQMEYDFTLERSLLQQTDPVDTTAAEETAEPTDAAEEEPQEE
ncbi:uncharacterized protein LOC116342082 [Contarinia nasturtii]|uniref:uncharacterized protein LOC116342082 n=1 Tax=Contarinia nasturtii TaxID=265458 RepID=UPI0012D38AC3|nr:uncharacterized protein LOC116342082 [Contarinia nasturtii]